MSTVNPPIILEDTGPAGYAMLVTANYRNALFLGFFEAKDTDHMKDWRSGNLRLDPNYNVNNFKRTCPTTWECGYREHIMCINTSKGIMLLNVCHGFAGANKSKLWALHDVANNRKDPIDETWNVRFSLQVSHTPSVDCMKSGVIYRAFKQHENQIGSLPMVTEFPEYVSIRPYLSPFFE
jgi:hypothetical protein